MKPIPSAHKFILLCIIFSFLVRTAGAQTNLRWFEINANTQAVISGRLGDSKEITQFDRLPLSMKNKVRPELWELSTNSAGEYIDFSTGATAITIKYQTSGSRSMPHMPATGVSGIDLYARDKDNNWHWARGQYSFGDTTTYLFKHLPARGNITAYRLYLPLYCRTVKLMVGVDNRETLTFLPANSRPPVVLYGTSILQGACASRPGLAWSNILGRKIESPVVNLGFSGNGRLEEALLSYMTTTVAALYVLDCQPNLHDSIAYPAAEIRRRIIKGIEILRKAHPQTPILLTAHSSGVRGINLDKQLNDKYVWTTEILYSVFRELRKAGHTKLYLLSAQDIGFDYECTVDGTHPNDLGMMKYAEAYTQKIQSILKKEQSK